MNHDLDWERYLPVLDIKFNTIQNIFTEYDKTIRVLNFRAIQTGCKNSNFIVYTNIGNNEIIDKIRVPALLFHKGNIFIYQYINAPTLQAHIIKNGEYEPPLLIQVAEAAAKIHNIAKEKTADLKKLDVPAFEAWYPAFLSTPAVKTLMGENLHKRTLQLVSDRHEQIGDRQVLFAYT